VGKVDELEDAVDDAVAHGEQRVDAPYGEAVDQLGQEVFHVSSYFRRK
jgi:hypothetical protein